MTIKESEGYWKNGAWYPYQQVRTELHGVTLEYPEKVYRCPGRFDISFSRKMTGEEAEQWIAVCEDLELTEKLPVGVIVNEIESDPREP